MDIAQFAIHLRKDTDWPIIDNLNLELAPRDNYQTEAAFLTRVILGHKLPTGSALTSRLLRIRVMGGMVVTLTTAAQRFIVVSTVVLGLQLL